MSDASAVIFTPDLDVEIAEIGRRARDARRLLLVHHRGHDVAAYREALPGFRFLAFEETCDPGNGWVQEESHDDDLTVLLRTCPSKIPDRCLGTYQSRTKGTKLALFDHPFCGRGEVEHLYFPFSYVDKTLLGYPHYYAMRSAGANGWDVEDLARRVAPAAWTTMTVVFDGIAVERFALTTEEARGYVDQKEALFAAGKQPASIVATLKRYVDGTASAKAAAKRVGATLPIGNLNKVWAAYAGGLRTVLVSDAKVDAHLLGRFEAYVEDANLFIQTLREEQNNG